MYNYQYKDDVMSARISLNPKELELLEIIKTLKNELKDAGIGIPLAELYRKIKGKGVYQSDYFISEKIKKFADLKLIKIDNWNITEVAEV